jgi:hypothetical protein
MSKGESMRLTATIFLLLCLSSVSAGQAVHRRANTPTNQASPPADLTPVIVVLKDGQSLKARFVSATAKSIVVMIGTSRQQFEITDVVNLVFDEKAFTSASKVSESSEAAKEVIKALRKLNSATSVGVNFSEYGRRLIDAKEVLDENLPRIPEGKLKDEINGAAQEYQLAASVWQTINDEMLHDRSNSGFLDIAKEPGASLVKLYKLKIEHLQYSQRDIILKSDILSAIWVSANSHTEVAASLLTEGAGALK